VAQTIEWSNDLDDEFIKNYQMDPALSWQYFCSSTGMMRQYPAVAWTQAQNKVDLYDCRKRSWYIEAATCSKDVVILFDNSGSMTGYNNFVARTTVKALLDTFSNNDFFTIFAFSNETSEVVPCFEDTLMQATPDNMRTFNSYLAGLKPEGPANFTTVFTRAFEVLERVSHSI
jgi:voltage-dependent calcium channel alpha-2/delta-4